MSKFNVLVAGSTGYIGIQLINLLIKHKYVNIKYLCGNSSVGKNIAVYDTKLKNKKLPKIKKFDYKFLKDVDIIFTALPNGEAQKISKKILSKNILIDLAADFRLEKVSDYLRWYKKKHQAPTLIKESFYKFSNHMRSSELALFSSVPQAALAYKIPIIFWGETPMQVGELGALGKEGWDGNNMKNSNTLKSGHEWITGKEYGQ